APPPPATRCRPPTGIQKEKGKLAAYAPPPPSTAPGPYVTAPPAGYPMSKDEYSQQNPAAVETKSRGDGFWKG
ncbi:hypothetical protein Golob_019396, partial [Gossypium lobatum]|nr:hypothetical protein [Gossypium lobatum]